MAAAEETGRRGNDGADREVTLISSDMALIDVIEAPLPVTPYLQTTAAAGGFPLPSAAARAIEAACWYCKRHAAVCASDEEVLASFVREVMVASLLKVKGHLDLGYRKIAGVIRGQEASRGFRGGLGSRKASRPPRRRRTANKSSSRGRGCWTPWKAVRPLLVASVALFVFACLRKDDGG